MNIQLWFGAMIASLIFFPSKDYTFRPEDFGLRHQSVEVLTKDNVKLAGWYFPSEPGSKVVYLLHGNAGNIGDRLFRVPEWLRRGFSVFLLDYRSYGKSGGNITAENDLYADAEAGLDWLKEAKKFSAADIVLSGESIGCAAVLELAQKGKFAGLILEAPFTSLAAIAKVHYPFVPAFFLSGFQFDNLAKISNIETPVFILHGEDDEICPFKMGEELFRRAPEPKYFFRIPGAHHNDLSEMAGKFFYDEPVEFLAKYFKESAKSETAS